MELVRDVYRISEDPQKIFSYEKYLKRAFLGHVTLKINRVACLSSPMHRGECTLEKSTATNLIFGSPQGF